MLEELKALADNKTWRLVPHPIDSKVVGSKWVYRIKYIDDGSLDRFKARFVAHGFTQAPDQDYDETFSPVVKPQQFDLLLLYFVIIMVCTTTRCKRVCLHGNLKEVVYMEQPAGFQDSTYSGHVCLP